MSAHPAQSTLSGKGTSYARSGVSHILRFRKGCSCISENSEGTSGSGFSNLIHEKRQKKSGQKTPLFFFCYFTSAGLYKGANVSPFHTNSFRVLPVSSLGKVISTAAEALSPAVTFSLVHTCSSRLPSYRAA